MTLLGEIFEQAEALERVVSRNREVAGHVAKLWRRDDVGHVVIAARGTSDNAARYAQYVWGARNRRLVGLATPSLYSLYDNPPNLKDAFVVGISQSGQSPDIVSVLAEARRQQRPTLAITNDGSSPLAAKADHVVLLHAGPEVAVAATKTYTSALAAVALLSGTIDGEAAIDDVLAELASQVRLMLGQSEDIATMARQLSSLDQCAVLGRGFNHATAFEWALKLQELSNVMAQPFSAADFLHGPLALVEPGFSILATAASGPSRADLHSLLEELVERGAGLVVISNIQETLDLTTFTIRLPVGVPEWITPIPAIVGAQLFTYHLAVAKGLDPDLPRGITKVTRTW